MSYKDTFQETVCKLIKRAETTIPADVKEALGDHAVEMYIKAKEIGGCE